jgi:integrase
MKTKTKKRIDSKYLFRRGAVWYVSGRDMNGKRIVQSTGTADLEEAREVRDRIMHPAKLKNERDRVAALQAQLGSIDQQLERIKDAVPSVTVSAGWQAYLDQQNRPDSGPSTLTQYEGWFEAFARWMDATHPKVIEVRHVTQDHADEYAAHLQSLVSATTFNRTVNALSLVWRVLEKPARLTVNPWKSITRKRYAVHSRRELTLAELQAVCSAATGEMRLLLALGVYAGLRLADAALLEWGSVDMVRRILSVIPVKTARRTQKRITVPIHPALLALLAETPEHRRKGYVMPGLAKRYWQYAGALSKDVIKLFQSCGITTTVKVAGSTRGRPECGFHSLRHSFVSLCAASGVPQSVVQALVGHGSPSMTMHYTHVGTEAAQNAVSLLPDVTGGTTPPPATDGQEGAILAVLEGLQGLDVPALNRVIQAAQDLVKESEA